MLDEFRSAITKGLRVESHEVVLTNDDQRKQLFSTLAEMEKQGPPEDGLPQLLEAAREPVT